MSGIKAADLSAIIKKKKMAAISVGSQALADEANAALGKTRTRGFQPNVFGGVVVGAGTGIIKAIEQQKAANAIKQAPAIAAPPPVRPYTDRLDNLFGGVA